MNGYVLHVRLRRAGAGETTERLLAVSDAGVARAVRLALFTLGALLLLLAPWAMAALTRPERGSKDVLGAEPGFIPTALLD